jgi:transcriptional regulator with XRE-family HTH domain
VQQIKIVMRIESQNTDEVVLAELGRRLARTRLERNISQAQLGEEAGVSRATVTRIEAGEPVKSTGLIRVLRALDLLEALDRLVPEPLPNPVERLKSQGRRRRRARPSRGGRNDDPAPPWVWNE